MSQDATRFIDVRFERAVDCAGKVDYLFNPFAENLCGSKDRIDVMEAVRGRCG